MTDQAESGDKAQPAGIGEQPFFSHLLELRDRLLRTVLVILVLFLGLFPFGNDIYHFVAGPLLEVMPEGTSMIATQVASPFLTPFKLSLMSAIFLAMPFVLYQAWSFVAPGLYKNEIRLALPLLVSSIVLFYAGMAFAYYVVFPLVFGFFTGVVPEGVAVMTDITHYLDFVLTLFFAFGVAFEIPIATILLVWMGVVTPEKLAGKRPFVIVGAFVIGMFLTPPDVISQSLLALPMWVLFELGIIFSRFFVKKGDDSESDDQADESQDLQEQDASDHQTQVAVATQISESDPDPFDNDDFVPLTEEELDAELDILEDEDEDDEEEDQEDGSTPDADPERDPVDLMLEEVARLRESMDLDGARTILYQVLTQGDDSQVTVAKNILAQLDTAD